MTTVPLPERAAIAAFVVALVIAALVTPHLERFAKTRRIGDRPGGLQNLRDHSTPRIGGVAILTAFYASLAALILYDGALASIVDHHRGAVYSLMAAGIAIGALGFYDDVHGTGARLKFSVQTLAALLLYYYGYRIDEVSLPGGATIDLGYLSLPLTLLWIVGVTNALNLVDGLDGLAGGVALFALLTNLVVAAVRPEPMMMLCMAALAGAVLGFLFYNFSPASIFMGDSGSLFLGLLLAATSLRTHQKSSAAVSLLVPIVALGLPIADTLLAMGRRAVNGRAMFIGDRDHIHHRLLRFGFTHRAAVLFLYGICLVLAAASLILAFSSSALIGLTLVLGAAVGWALLRNLGFLRMHPDLLRSRRRNRELRTAAARIAVQIESALTIKDVLSSASALQPLVGADAVSIELSDDGLERRRGYADPCPILDAMREVPSVRIDLPDRLGWMDLKWSDGRSQIDPDHALATEVICKHVARAIRRVRRTTAGRSVGIPQIAGAISLGRGGPRRESQ